MFLFFFLLCGCCPCGEHKPETTDGMKVGVNRWPAPELYYQPIKLTNETGI